MDGNREISSHETRKVWLVLEVLEGRSVLESEHKDQVDVSSNGYELEASPGGNWRRLGTLRPCTGDARNRCSPGPVE